MIGQEVVEDLLKVFTDRKEKAEKRIDALWIVKILEPEKGKFVKILVDTATDRKESAEVRTSAASCLALIGPDTNAAVPGLRVALAVTSPGVRAEAAISLGRLGPDAKGAVGRLIRVLKKTGEDLEVRQAVMTALGQIGPAARKAVPALIEIVRGEDKREANLASSSLQKIGPDAVDALASVAGDKQEKAETRSLAIRVLGNLGPVAKSALPALKRVYDDEDDEQSVRMSTGTALARIDPKLKKTLRLGKE